MQQNPIMRAKEEFCYIICEAIKKAYPSVDIKKEQVMSSIAEAKPGFGDLSSSLSFGVARQLRMRPADVAKNIVSASTKGLLINEISEAFGYINAKISGPEYAKIVLDAISGLRELYGFNSSGSGRKVMVEGPSVNPNKPWHIGHLRNALLCDAVSNLLLANGYNVERTDYIDDLGLQVAESLWGMQNLGNAPEGKLDHWLGEQYVLVNKKIGQDKAIFEEIKELNRKMEDPATTEAREARKLAESCVRAQYETGSEYRISHDLLVWESDILSAKLLEKSIAMLDSRKAIERPSSGKYAGCITLPLENSKDFANEFKNPSEETKVLIRSNGTATYVAKDIAFHMWKFGIIEDNFKYKQFMEKQPNGKPLYTTSPEGVHASFGKAATVVNIIGASQKYAQLILRLAFSLSGYKEISNNIVHLAYGEVSVEGGSLSGREGGWMGEEGRSFTADSLLAEVNKKALEIVKKSKKIENTEKSEEIAKSVALGSIKFEFLRIAPEKPVIFSWEKALNFEGSSAPYCMYTYARARRIIEKAGSSPIRLDSDDYKQMGSGADFELLKALGKAPEIVEKACNDYRPNLLVDYLLELSSLFSKFYENMQVIKGGEARSIRLSLVSATMQTIRNMLLLLGIETVEYM
ncbi:MAG: arginine--tRNA ligase [Candidatus Micrarchaeaceae archaeon]